MPLLIRDLQRAIKLDLQRIERDLHRALSLARHPDAEVGVLFVGSRRMRRLNERYRGIPLETDVLSFPMLDKSRPFFPPVLGDIVISVPRAVRQARQAGHPLSEELRRLLIHGLLHLLGFDHEAGSAEQKRMSRKERKLIESLASMD